MFTPLYVFCEVVETQCPQCKVQAEAGETIEHSDLTQQAARWQQRVSCIIERVGERIKKQEMKEAAD
jgi:phage FluMu protein Com